MAFLFLLSLGAFCQEVTNQVEISAIPTAEAGIHKVEWKQISGPGTPTIVSPGSNKTMVSNFIVPGDYVFEFTVTDKAGQTASVRITGKVLPPWAGPSAVAEGFIIRLDVRK